MLWGRAESVERLALIFCTFSQIFGIWRVWKIGGIFFDRSEIFPRVSLNYAVTID